MFSAEDLVRNGFVTPEKQEALQQYLSAKQQFLDCFTSANHEPLKDKIEEAEEALSRANDRNKDLFHLLLEHCDFVKTRPLAALKIVYGKEPSRLTRLSEQIDCLSHRAQTLKDGLSMKHLEGVKTEYEQLRNEIEVFRKEVMGTASDSGVGQSKAPLRNRRSST